MEASQVESGEAQTPETGGEAQAGAEQQPNEIGQVLDRFNELERGYTERFDRLEERIPEQDMGLEQEGGDLQYLYDEGGQMIGALDGEGRLVEPGGMAGGYDQEAAMQAAQQEMRQEMQQQLAPILEHFADQAAAEVESRYPELRDKDVAEKLMGVAEQKAAALAGGDQRLAAQIAQKPEFAEMVYLAEKAREQATSETPAGAADDEVLLEGGAGSHPGAGEQDEGDRIAGAYRSGSGFWNS